MATGIRIAGNLGIKATDYPAWDFVARTPPSVPFYFGAHPSKPKVATTGAYSPVAVTPEAKTGREIRAFQYDWYYRIHVTPRSIDIGNLLSLQSREVKVWNAYFVTKTLDAVQQTVDSGVSLIQPEAPPSTYLALAQKNYQVQVTVDGPPVILGEFRFDFGAEQVGLSVKGSRIVVWPYPPQHGVTEALEWNTNIMRAKAGEQRIALRDAPRQSFEFSYFMTERQASRARATMYGWGSNLYGIPVWTEATGIGALASGSSYVPANTAASDLRVGTYMLVWENDEKFEAVQIASMDAGGVTTALPTVNDFTAAFTIPMRYARSDGLSLNRGPNSLVKADSSFTVTDNFDLGASIGFPQHDGIDVMTDINYFVDSYDERVERVVDTIDNGFGNVYTKPKFDYPDETFTVTWETKSLAELWRLRKWLFGLKGKWKTFWLPSPGNDLTLVVDASAGDTGIEVMSIDYALFFQTRTIRIQRNNGTTTYHNITGGVTLGNVDTLSIVGSLGASTLISEVSKISFMHKVRLDTDRIEISHDMNRTAIVKVPVIEVPA